MNTARCKLHALSAMLLIAVTSMVITDAETATAAGGGAGPFNTKQTAAVFRPSNGNFYINHQFDAQYNLSFEFGMNGDLAIAGDWNADNYDTVGVFRPSNGNFYLNNELDGSVSHAVQYGMAGDRPVAGDWDRDGDDTIGVFRPSNATWYFNNEIDGTVTAARQFGLAGDRPIAGDWNGDGKDTMGVFRPSNGTVYLSNDFNSDVEVSYTYGLAGDIPVAGDFDGDGDDTVAQFRPSTGMFYFNNGLDSVHDAAIQYGISGDQPLAGDWDGYHPPSQAVVTIADLEAIWGPIGSSRPVVEAGMSSLNDAMISGGITTPARKAAFLATLRNESGFRYNAVEGGSTSTYRGRGFIQLTGSFNYDSAGRWLGYDLVSDPGAAASLSLSAPIAQWYWTVARHINQLADQLDMAAVNVAIGYAPSSGEDAERCEDFKAALRYFNNGALPAGVNCIRGATSASREEMGPVYSQDTPKGVGVGT